jgi:hypothetical protein
MATTRQMFDHTLDAIKGWFHMAALDFTAKLSSNVTVDVVYAGRCVHLNSSGEFELGCTGSQMPIFLLQNSDDNDVSNSGGTRWYPIGPAGNITGLVAKGAYELETTEFDSANTYAPNEYLRCKSSSNSSTDGGLLTNASVSVLEDGGSNPTAIVGVVSRGVRKRQSDRNNVLAFWPIYKPGKTGY